MCCSTETVLLDREFVQAAGPAAARDKAPTVAADRPPLLRGDTCNSYCRETAAAAGERQLLLLLLLERETATGWSVITEVGVKFFQRILSSINIQTSCFYKETAAAVRDSG